MHKRGVSILALVSLNSVRSLLFSFWMVWLFTGIGLPSAAHAGSAFVNGSTYCLPQYNKWKKRPGWKAYALNRVVNNKQVCGWSYSAPSKQAATADALKYCRLNERKAPGFGKKGSCYVYDFQR